MASKLPSSTAGADVNSLSRSFHTPPLDWREAMRAATARVNEGWELPETRCHPAVEEELAALLCAYGVLGDEVDRMHGGGPPSASHHPSETASAASKTSGPMN